MSQLKEYISKKLDVILSEADKSKRSPSVVADKLKSFGVPAKTIKKTVGRLKAVKAPEVEDNFPSTDLFPGRIHSDKEIKDIVTIRKLFKSKSPKFVEKNLQKEKKSFISHYDNLYNNGASELPGILELYSLYKSKRERPNLGKGVLFKMLPEDAKAYSKDIVKYFLVKNAGIFPINKRAKIAFDAYVNLLELSKVDISYIKKMKNYYYKKYKL